MVEPRKPSNRERFNISRLAIQHSWFTLGFWIAVVVAGALALSSLKYALFPDITFPVVVVNASAPIETAINTETRLTQPIEQQFQGLAGLDDISSTTYPGQSVVSLSFAVGTNLEQSSRQVEQTLRQVKLPDNTSTKVIPINLNEAAVISYAIESPSQSIETLAQTAKTSIVPELAQVPGVLKVNLLGEPVPFDIKQLAAGQSGGTLVRFNGQQALAVQVIKRADANTLEVVRRIEQKIRQIQTRLPNVKLTVAATQADYIQAATSETIHALVEAIILSIVVIYPFLWNWRATLISALAIPISLLGTFIVMAIYGFNLETITLLALAMVIGSIVDDAIVDVENIARHIEAGESPKQAAISATNEIGLTVTAATLTVVAVFLPVGMMGGVLGQFFKPFGITISAAMLASLLVARTLSPLLAARWFKPQRQQEHESRMSRAFQNSFTNLNAHYRGWLHWSLKHRGWVIGISVVSFAIGIALIPLIPKGFIPKLDRGEFNISYTAPVPEIPQALLQMQDTGAGNARQSARQNSAQGSGEGSRSSSGESSRLSSEQSSTQNSPQNSTQRSSRNTAADRSSPASASGQNRSPAANSRSASNSRSPQPNAAAANRAPQIPPQLLAFNPLEDSLKVAEKLDSYAQSSAQVQTVFTIVGSRQGEPNKGTLYIKLKDDRSLTTAQVQDRFRQQLPKLEGVNTSVEDIQFVDTGGEKPVQVQIAGNDLAALNQAARQIQQRLQKIPGFEDVTTTGETNQGNIINEIQRSNGQRVATISANLGAGLSLGQATDRATAEAQAVLPPGVTLKLGGDSARVNEILGSFGSTLALSILCIIVVLFLLFKDWIDALVIFLSLPLSIVGAMLGLLVIQSDFGMISLIGILFLLGLTNKNAILIVDYIKQLRRSGMERQAAILEAGPVRLRPILMTTAATILGMVPIALGLGAGAELRAPMAVAIMGGLITSTLLSLFVVPVLYDWLDDWRSKWKRG